jgi:hypothetical protein
LRSSDHQEQAYFGHCGSVEGHVGAVEHPLHYVCAGRWSRCGRFPRRRSGTTPTP